MLWWRFMLSIHLEVKDFGNKDETNYETDEINKENTRVLHFYCWPKIGKYKTYNKIRQANLLQVLSKEEGVEGSKRRTFSHRKTFVKQKNGVAYEPSTFTYFQRNVHRSSSGNSKKLYLRGHFIKNALPVSRYIKAVT